MRRTVDTFDDFLLVWNSVRGERIEQQIRSWETEYLGKWPALLHHVIEDYRDNPDHDWFSVARDRIFPFLDSRLNQMEEARKHLLECLPLVQERAMNLFDIEETDLLNVIYVGIGGGAGWVTQIDGTHSILFGLEMIAECGWFERKVIEGLAAHETGHAVHGVLRNDPGLAEGCSSWWQLYIEGFAQRCEHIIARSHSWHMGNGNKPSDWLEWCTINRNRLAKEFLHAADLDDNTRDFFGSWFDIDGYSQCGYYLGHEVLLELEKRVSISDIAVLKDYEGECRAVLEEFSNEGYQ